MYNLTPFTGHGRSAIDVGLVERTRAGEEKSFSDSRKIVFSWVTVLLIGEDP